MEKERVYFTTRGINHPLAGNYAFRKKYRFDIYIYLCYKVIVNLLFFIKFNNRLIHNSEGNKI